MSSGWIHRQTYISCDSCPETIEGADFKVLWNSIVSSGWTAKNINGKWSHYCPECSKDFGRVKAVNRARVREF